MQKVFINMHAVFQTPSDSLHIFVFSAAELQNNVMRERVLQERQPRVVTPICIRQELLLVWYEQGEEAATGCLATVLPLTFVGHGSRPRGLRVT